MSVLKIGGHRYSCSRIEPDPEVARVAFRLEKLTGPRHGAKYDVWTDEFGIHCDCWDFLAHENSGKPCKHLKTLQAKGLL